MPLLEIIILAVVQAFTEFLPISSSGHLYLASLWFGWSYQGLTFDLGLHLGTLIAVLVYFRKDWLEMGNAALRFRPGATVSPALRLLGILLIATIPAALVGLWMSSQDGLTAAMRNPMLIGANLVCFGIALWYAFRQGGVRSLNELSWREGLFLGAAQALALVPGVSRSGITMTAGMLRGLSAQDAARFSFLMAVPVTSLAAAKGVLDLVRGVEPIVMTDFLLGAFLAACAGLLVVHFFLTFLRSIGLVPFVIYRLLLGTGVLIYYGLVHG